MITILGVNKSGNKILNYDCTDGSKSLKLTKEEVAKLIKNKEVSNAKMQVYKGTIIIRIKDSIKINNTKSIKQVTKKNNDTVKKQVITEQEVNTAAKTMEELFGKFDTIEDMYKEEDII